MSKTYDLEATLKTGKNLDASPSGDWRGYDSTNVNSSDLGKVGRESGPIFWATNMVFDSATLSTLRNKTINGITLEINVTQATGAPGLIAWKYNSAASGNTNSQAWARSDNAGTYTAGDSSIATNSNPSFAENGITVGTHTLTIKALPQYGLVAGPYSSSRNGVWKFSSAILHVTTNETDYSYTLSYNANGGSGAPGSQQQTVTAVTAPSMAFTISNTRPTRTGYDFLGWSTSSSASTASYQPGGSITISGNTTLYAVWKVITYTVSYNANGGSGAPASQTKTYNVTLTLSGTAPTRTGYTFLGWSTSNTATTATYSAGGSYTANASTTLYAVWQVVTYTITYRPGTSGTGSVATATKTYNVALTLKGATYTRSGYAQTGWATSDGGAQAYALSASYTANAAATLYPVWTATKSTITATNGNLNDDNNKCKITITSQNSSFTHTLTYSYGGATGTIATGVSGASPITYNWKPSADLAAQFTSAKSGTCTITCTTYNGGTSLGTSTATCTLTIPSSICCTVNSVAVAETVAGLASQFGGFVQGKSKAKLTGTISSGSGSPAYGATVASYTITVNGQTLTSNGATTGFLNNSGSNSYSFKITDTRGYSHTKTDSFTVLAYSAPTVSATVQRNSSDSSKIDVSYSYSISSVNSHNTKGLSLKYKPIGGSYTTVSLTASSYSGSGTYQITGLDANTAYEVVVTVSDYFGSTSNTSQINPTGNRVFDISNTDKTMARHGTCPSDGWDHQFFKEQFHGVVDIVPWRCYSQLPTSGNGAGWYRVLTLTGDAAGRPLGNPSFNVDITILRQYGSTNNELHKISLFATYNSVAFSSEESKSNAILIDKIRYLQNGNYGYVDIHYNSSATNNVAVHFDVHAYPVYSSMFAATTPTKVADSPSGETVLTEHSFIANGHNFTMPIYMNGTLIHS